MMTGREMPDEAPALPPRLVAKAKQGGDFAVDEQNAFQASRRRQPRRRTRTERFAARNRQLPSADSARQSLSRNLGDFIGGHQDEASLRRRAQQAGRQRMF